MKFKYLFLFILSISIAKAQQIQLKGNIIDAQTHQPIPAATISVQAKELCYHADNNGKFDIVTDKLNLTDSVIVSCIGYQTQKTIVSHLLNSQTIKLNAKLSILQEVKVNVTPSILIKVGSKARSDDLMSSCLPEQEMMMFMEGSKNNKGKIRSISFYLGDGHLLSPNSGGDVTTPFRIKLYGVDTNGNPGAELTKDTIIVRAKKNNEWFYVDVSEYHIDNPDSGFYVAFCLLNSSYYKIKKGYIGLRINDIIAPRLGTTKYEYKDTRSYWAMYNETYGWYWTKNCQNYSYMIRATIAPE